MIKEKHVRMVSRDFFLSSQKRGDTSEWKRSTGQASEWEPCAGRALGITKGVNKALNAMPRNLALALYSGLQSSGPKFLNFQMEKYLLLQYVKLQT